MVVLACISEPFFQHGQLVSWTELTNACIAYPACQTGPDPSESNSSTPPVAAHADTIRLLRPGSVITLLVPCPTIPLPTDLSSFYCSHDDSKAPLCEPVTETGVILQDNVRISPMLFSTLPAVWFPGVLSHRHRYGIEIPSPMSPFVTAWSRMVPYLMICIATAMAFSSKGAFCPKIILSLPVCIAFALPRAPCGQFPPFSLYDPKNGNDQVEACARFLGSSLVHIGHDDPIDHDVVSRTNSCLVQQFSVQSSSVRYQNSLSNVCI